MAKHNKSNPVFEQNFAPRKAFKAVQSMYWKILAKIKPKNSPMDDDYKPDNIQALLKAIKENSELVNFLSKLDNPMRNKWFDFAYYGVTPSKQVGTPQSNKIAAHTHVALTPQPAPVDKKDKKKKKKKRRISPK